VALTAVDHYRVTAADLIRSCAVTKPHRHLKDIAGIRWRGEAPTDLQELSRVVVTDMPQQCACRKTVGAQPMQYRPWKTPALGDIWVHVEWIAVARLPKQQGLVGHRRHLDF
jgi:hypothetical protein